MSTKPEMEQLADGVQLNVEAQPGSRKNELRGVQEGRLKVCVTQVAEKGKANQAIIKLLAKQLKLPTSRISLRKGELFALKTFFVSGVTVADLAIRIQDALNSN